MMKKNKYILKVSNPCKENWSAMIKFEQGRFCDRCSKNVMDFTIFTDQQLIDYLENTKGSICGRLKPTQLDKEIAHKTSHAGFGRLLTLLTGLTLFAPTKKAFSFKNELSQISQINEIGKSNSTVSPVQALDSLKYVVEGIILDSETKEPLFGATVGLLGKKYGVQADQEGRFKMEIAEKLLKKNMIIRVGYVGYYFKEYTIARNELPMNRSFLLESNTAFLGEVVIINSEKKWWHRKKKKCN